MPRPSARERAAAWIAKSAPAAVQGQHGDSATFSVACALVIEFGLAKNDAWDLLCEYNRTKCSPQWDERELEVKLRSARNMAAKKPGEVGRLLGQDRGNYTGPKQASAASPVAAPSRPAPSAPVPPRPEEVARTARTPFSVTPAGRGAKRARCHTLRTLPSYSLRIEEKGSSLNVRSGAGVSDPSGASAASPEVKPSRAEASEPSVTQPAVSEAQPESGKASEASAPTFAGKQHKGVGQGGAIAALARDGINAGHVVTWIGASGNIVRFGRDGRPRKFGVIKE